MICWGQAAVCAVCIRTAAFAAIVGGQWRCMGRGRVTLGKDAGNNVMAWQLT